MTKLWIDRDIWAKMTPEERKEVERFRKKVDRRGERRGIQKPIFARQAEPKGNDR